MEQIFSKVGFNFPGEDRLFFVILLSIHLVFSLFLSIIAIRPLPYGRYDSTKFKFNSKISWLIMETPAFFIPLFVLRNSPSRDLTFFSANIFFLLPFTLHYFHRALIYPLSLSTSSVPLIAMFLGFIYTSFNSYLQSTYILALTDLKFTNLSFSRYIVGMCIFFLGMYINIHADYYLVKLSKNKKRKGQYFIPRGFLFEYISCPNFFGETLEWLGYAIATWTLCGWVFFLQTSLTILPRGYHHHKFYKLKFEDYPPRRKAVIPFVM